MIFNVAHTKGGVGKSTIATNLAVEMKADLLDLDTQNSSIAFSQFGPKREFKFLRGQDYVNSDLAFLEQYHGEKNLIVDSGGYDSAIVRKILLASDIVLTPVAASQVELLGLLNFDKVIHLIKAARPEIKPLILFNRVTRFQAKDLEAFKNYISQNVPDYKILETELGDRKIFKDAFSEGKSVCELKPKSQAANELRDLITEILNIAKGE